MFLIDSLIMSGISSSDYNIHTFQPLYILYVVVVVVRLLAASVEGLPQQTN